MEKEDLPKTFQEYWTQVKKLPNNEARKKNTDSLSSEWNDFLAALKKKVEKDLKQED